MSTYCKSREFKALNEGKIKVSSFKFYCCNLVSFLVVLSLSRTL